MSVDITLKNVKPGTKQPEPRTAAGSTTYAPIITEDGKNGSVLGLAKFTLKNAQKTRFLPYTLQKEPVNREILRFFTAKFHKSASLLGLKGV